MIRKNQVPGSITMFCRAVTELWSDGHQTLVALRALAQHPDGRAITGRNVLMYWTYLEVS